MKPKISVIVPCFEESENIDELCTRLQKMAVNTKLTIEIILVDDYSGKGSEDTKDVVSKLKKKGQENIRLVVRLPNQGKGLSSAVLYGISLAKSDLFVIMDADLQHEPESLPNLVKPLIEREADFIYGSRHVSGGSAKQFSTFRRIVSFGATLMARGLTSQSDPMSGFFALNTNTYKRALENNVNPLGYKIGLELLVRSKISSERVKDVPIRFQKRNAGSSKLSSKQYIYYILHVLRLYWFLYSTYFFLIALLLLLLLVTHSSK